MVEEKKGLAEAEFCVGGLKKREPVLSPLKRFARNPAALEVLQALAGRVDSGVAGRDSKQRELTGYG